MNNFIKIFLGALLGIFSLFCQISYAASDIVAQNYAAARSANIQSCTAGYDLVSGDITYHKAHILGALPYHLNYRAPLRQNLSAAQTFAQPESTSLGWADNYQAHVFVQNLSAQTRQYQNYTTQVNGQSYILSTSNPVVTASFSVKEIFVRLPGETVDTIFKEENGKFTRLYSADAVRDLNNYGLRQLSWSSDLGEYQMSRSGNNLIIIKNGIQYTVSDVSYTMSPAQTHTEAINLYVDKSGYLRTTTDSWDWPVFFMPSYANSNTAPYIETKTTVSMNLHRITQINQQGRNLNLEYDHLLNLTQVTDNFNNKLVFERTFHDPGLGANQTVDESRLITKVSYSSGSQGDSQTVEFDYQAYTNKVPSTGANTVVFALVRSNSTAGGCL